MREEDACAFVEVHHTAIRALAAGHYPAEVIDDWAPLPVTEEAVRRTSADPDEVRLVAEAGGAVIGLAVLVPARGELRACYVAPQAAGRGIGAALVGEVERLARANECAVLELDASLNAEPFYAHLGYESLGRGEHALRTGRLMTCVRMRKRLKT